jgi:hypothetical protein
MPDIGEWISDHKAVVIGGFAVGGGLLLYLFLHNRSSASQSQPLVAQSPNWQLTSVPPGETITITSGGGDGTPSAPVNAQSVPSAAQPVLHGTAIVSNTQNASGGTQGSLGGNPSTSAANDFYKALAIYHQSPTGSLFSLQQNAQTLGKFFTYLATHTQAQDVALENELGSMTPAQARFLATATPQQLAFLKAISNAQST